MVTTLSMDTGTGNITVNLRSYVRPSLGMQDSPHHSIYLWMKIKHTCVVLRCLLLIKQHYIISIYTYVHCCTYSGVFFKIIIVPAFSSVSSLLPFMYVASRFDLSDILLLLSFTVVHERRTWPHYSPCKNVPAASWRFSSMRLYGTVLINILKRDGSAHY